jgi:hypothetical protein
MKHIRIQIPPIDPSVTAVIVQTYFDMTEFSQNQQSEFYRSISFNGRAIQFTLRKLSVAFGSATTDEVTFEHLKAKTNEAYDDWEFITIAKIGDQSAVAKYTNQILVAFLYPDNLNIKHGLQDGEHYLEFTNDSFPSLWGDASVSGALRIQPMDSSLRVFQPQGFLLRYFSNKAKALDATTRVFLYASTAVCGIEKIGSPGHLFERMIATGNSTTEILEYIRARNSNISTLSKNNFSFGK